MEPTVIIDALRVLSLLAVVICQVFIARAMWVFAKHNVIAFSTSHMANLAVMSTALLAVATVLLLVKLTLF